MEAPTSAAIDTSCDCDGNGEEAAKSPSKRRRGYIPYATIYESQDEVRKHGYWIPGIPVEAAIVKVERDTSSGYHILNPFIYTIELEHGRYKWKVLKHYKDFSYLSSRLMAHRAAEMIKAPVRRARNRIEEVIEGVATDEDDAKKEKVRYMDTRERSHKELIGTIEATIQAVEEAEEEITKPPQIELPRFGETQHHWRVEVEKKAVVDRLAAIGAATAEVVQFTTIPEESPVDTRVGNAIAIIGSNLPDMGRGVRQLAALLPDKHRAVDLIDAARKLCGSFGDFLDKIHPERQKKRPNILSAASRVGELCQDMINAMQEHAEDERSFHSDELNRKARTVETSTAQLVLQAKMVSAKCEEPTLKDQVIHSAMETAFATSVLITCTRLVGPTIEHQQCKELLTYAAQNVTRAVQDLVKDASKACQRTTPEKGKEHFGNLNQLAGRVSNALDDLIGQEEPLGYNRKTKQDCTFERRTSSDPTTLPHFPVLPDSILSEAQMDERARKLEKWLRSVLAIPINREYHETAEFLDVSRYSFINELGGKYREGKVKKRPGGNKVYIGCKQFCISWLLPWSRRWLMVKDTYVCYMDPSNEEIRLVLLFDEQFEINSPELAANVRPKDFVISNLQHVLMLKCSNEEETDAWVDSIKTVLDDTGQIWLHKKRYGSSFPQRLNSYCQWFVDAKDCWEKAASLIEMAREEIFIADWWLSPEIYLRRPMAEGNHWRLDYALKRKAEKGVRIFILIYKEMEMALGLKSLYSKKHLQGLHPNIKVMRHPDHYLGSGTFFWAHHEKLLIIDQLIAFVGGVDFCYGRWDDHQHLLTDLGSVRFSPRSEECKIEVIAAEDLQEKITGEKEKHQEKHLQEVHRFTEDIIDEETGKKIGEKITSTITPVQPEKTPKEVDGSTERPTTTKDHWSTPKQPKLRDVMQRAMSKVRSTGRRHSREVTPIETPKTTLTLDGVDKTELLKDKDGKPVIRFTNFTSNLSALEEHDSTDITNTTTEGSPSTAERHPKMGITPALLPMEPKQRTLMRRVITNLRPERARKRWRLALQPSEEAQDEYIVNYCRLQETKVDMSGLQGAGKLWPGKDYVNYIHKDFVDVDVAYSDFINRYDTPRMPWHDIHSIVYGSAARDVARHFIQRWNATKTEKLKDDPAYPYLLPKSYNSVRVPKIFFGPETQRVEVQVLRSVAHWSSLIDKTEDSIQQAYLSLIANARHYVYIENQFFVSMMGGSDVHNEICRVLHDRILRAHQNKETFRVFVLIPLLPGFEGDIGATSYSALLAVLHWTMLSIAKGEHSLVEQLRASGVTNVKDYISFCSLRTLDELCGKMVTELIYIHSKLMIVDDLHTIIGSANINDRSQAGNRDSEVCLLITDHEFVESRMNGMPFNAGKFAFSLRKRLMMEHLGLLDDAYPRTKAKQPIDVNDPVCPTFYEDIWCKIAESNTRIYEEVFRCYPTNLVETFEELLAWRSEKKMTEDEPEKAHKELANLIGSLVEFPIHFLRKENLSPTFASKEGLVSSSIFT